MLAYYQVTGFENISTVLCEIHLNLIYAVNLPDAVMLGRVVDEGRASSLGLQVM